MSLAGAFVVLVLLQSKHFLADYVLQTPFMFQNKGRYGHPGGVLHAGFHAGLTAVVLLLAGVAGNVLIWVVLAEFLVHYHVDWAKEKYHKNNNLSPELPRYWNLHGLDQWLHQLTYVTIVWVLL